MVDATAEAGTRSGNLPYGQLNVNSETLERSKIHAGEERPSILLEMLRVYDHDEPIFELVDDNSRTCYFQVTIPAQSLGRSIAGGEPHHVFHRLDLWRLPGCRAGRGI